MNASRVVVALLTSLGVAVLAWPSVQTPTARIVYNPSDSVPPGWYRIGPPESLHVGSIVLVRLPADTAALAAQRGYLPEHVPLLKRIGAMSPQQVCIEKHIVRIDGMAVAGVHATEAVAVDCWPGSNVGGFTMVSCSCSVQPIRHRLTAGTSVPLLSPP